MTINESMIAQEVQTIAPVGATPGSITIVGFDVELNQEAIGYAVLPTGPLPTSQYNVAVYGDTVTIAGDLVNPGMNLMICAREVVIGATTILNTSGGDVFASGDYPPLTPPATGPGAAGVAGNPAGNLTLAADVISVSGPDAGAGSNGRLASLNQALYETVAGLLRAGSPILA